MSNYAGLGGGSGGGGGGEEVQVYKQRVQLADLPAATTTGVVAWTTAVPTGSLVVGGALGINADVDLGARCSWYWFPSGLDVGELSK